MTARTSTNSVSPFYYNCTSFISYWCGQPLPLLWKMPVSKPHSSCMPCPFDSHSYIDHIMLHSAMAITVRELTLVSALMSLTVGFNFRGVCLRLVDGGLSSGRIRRQDDGWDCMHISWNTHLISITDGHEFGSHTWHHYDLSMFS